MKTSVTSIPIFSIWSNGAKLEALGIIEQPALVYLTTKSAEFERTKSEMVEGQNDFQIC